ncbi:MAG: hypothetical protein JKY20_09005 [Alphaproteobacteria bacterium]|nr:hypothetical protein [Alphaproteobacteria bacterium]
MTHNDDILFLESFREAIIRFLIVGAAPTMDPLWGGTALIEMREAMKIEEFQTLRRDINKSKGRAAQILDGLGIVCTFNQYPPPAVGGAVTKFPLFDLITDNRSRHSIDGSAFTDKLDEAIGLLQFKSAEKAVEASKREPSDNAELGPATPCLLVRDLKASLLFYRERLGFEAPASLAPESEVFVLIQRGAAQLLLKPLQNGSDTTARLSETSWDVLIHTPKPDVLLAVFQESGANPQSLTEGGLGGFTVCDPDGNCLFFC